MCVSLSVCLLFCVSVICLFISSLYFWFQNSAKMSVKERLGFPVKPALPVEKVSEVLDLYHNYNNTIYPNK